MSRLTYIACGPAADLPRGTVLPLTRSAPGAAALYAHRVAALQRVRTEYFCWLDGGEDRLLPNFEAVAADLLERLDATGAALGHCGELAANVERPGQAFDLQAYLLDHTLLHHGVVCRTAPAMAIDWPRGCHLFEIVCYGSLARLGAIHVPDIAYHWRPSPSGARLWPSTARAIVNSKRWLRGLPGGAHFDSDFR